MNNDYGNLQLHKVLLRAMKDIDSICREHGLRYYLYAGTLLGAVNHGGFIPWDDDVDIVMFPDDFEKLSKIIESQYSKYYKMLTFDNTKDWYSMMNKLQVLGSAVVYDDGSESPIFVDINILHSVPDSTKARVAHERRIKWLNMGLYVLSGAVIPTSVKSKMTIGMLSKLGKERLGKKMRRAMCKYDNKETEMVGILCNTLTANPYTGRSGYITDLTRRQSHKSYIYIPFEDTELMTIGNYDEYLQYHYGPHYKDPYPEEKRITKHGVSGYEVESWVVERCDN